MDGGKFFGAFRACSGITDAVVLNHVPIGCNWGAGMFKSTSDQLDIRHACTVMHEREIVFGGEKSLRESLYRADSLYQASLIIVAVGDVPSIIGDDIEAVIGSVNLKKPVVWVDAAGFKGTMRSGYEEALISLAPLMKECKTVKGSVNLIGICHDDFKAIADVRELKRMLEQAGIEVNCVISNCSYDQFIKASAAELNLVLDRGVNLGRLMHEKYGIPYVAIDYPYGIEASRKMICTASDQLGAGFDLEETDLGPFRNIYIWLNELLDTPVSVIGDFSAHSMANFLDCELGLEIEVLSTIESDYFSFMQDVRRSNSMMIFGSSFEKKLASELEIPLIRYSYPVFDQVSIYNDSPYVGIRGAINLTETILNSIMSFECNSKHNEGVMCL